MKNELAKLPMGTSGIIRGNGQSRDISTEIHTDSARKDHAIVASRISKPIGKKTGIGCGMEELTQVS